MKTPWKITLGATALALALSGCAGAPAQTTAPEASASETAAASSEPTATSSETVVGIQEMEVGDSGPQKAGDYLVVSAVYFQAVDLEQGSMAMPAAADSDMHFEIDVKTTDAAKDIGLEADQFLPYLKITPKLTEKTTGKVVELGTLMPMIASDGPHYGNNISLDPGTYTVELTIQSPADDFMLHTGKDSSGVKGRFWSDPLKVTFDNFEWDGQLL
ncbi:iron transporter [Propionicimonas sp.]|uniref:iron transporter n=1 Tax=Propionicimonas sp. TaxID=1955623 RepID=UPI0039E3BD31